MNKTHIKMALLIAILVFVVILIMLLIFSSRQKDEDLWEDNELYDDYEDYEQDDVNLEILEDNDEEKLELNIQATEILDLIKNDWDIRKVNLGTRESTCDEYDIYFDEGIEVRTVAGKVFNIVFTHRYQGSLVNNLKTTSSVDEVMRNLGEPTFKLEDNELYINKEEANEERYLIGYLGEEIYIFFSNNDISIYPIQEIQDIDEVIEKIGELASEKDISKFVNDITDIWNDFDVYNSSENTININYTLKGFCLNWNPYIGKRIILI